MHFEPGCATIQSSIKKRLYIVNKKVTAMSTLAHFSQRIADKSNDYQSGGPILIVAFGDSVTMGATVSGTLIPDDVYHQRLKRMLEREYPKAIFSVINSGIGGENAAQGLRRLDRDVLRYQPDLVIIGFGLNDATGHPEDTDDYEKHLANMIEQIREKTSADILLLTPNFMNSRAETECCDSTLTDRFMDLSKRFSAIQNAGQLAHYAAAARKVAQRYSIPVADVYRQWQNIADSGVDTMTLLANRLNHPIPSAHQIAADAIFNIVTGKTS